MGEGDGEAEGEEVGDGFSVRSVVSGSVEGMGVDVVVGSVRSVVRIGGSYGPLSDTDNVIPTSTAATATTGVSTTTRGTRTNGRTRPSKKCHKSTATTTSTAAGIHHGYASIGSTYPPNTLLHQGRPSFALVLYYLLRCDTSSVICSFISRIAPVM